MRQDELNEIMEKVFKECDSLRSAGQQEYARQESNAFGNFERIAYWLEGMTITRETVLLVYALKHLDGVISYLSGHTSQREDVRGRINDFIVYMTILRGMIEENESDTTTYASWEPGQPWISDSTVIRER